MKKFYVLAILIFAISIDTFSVTKTSTGSGAWETSSTWSPSGAPSCGDSVIIIQNHTITINSQQNYSGCGAYMRLAVRGLLYFMNGNKLRLSCNSRLYVFSTGALDSDGSGNSNQLEICGDTEWSGTMGKYSGPTCIPTNAPGCNGILPVELVNFNGTVCGNSVCFSWSTFSEKNNDRFELQRSQDGASFTTVGEIQSLTLNGYSTSKLNYSAVDNDPAGPLAYYRLKQVDHSGDYSYSRIVAVNTAESRQNNFILYPNPNNGSFSVKMSGIREGAPVALVVRNNLGEVIWSESFIAGTEVLEVNAEGRLQPGSYAITFSADSKDHTSRMLVQ